MAQAYFMLDEMLIAGELQEPSKKVHLITAASQGVLVLKSASPHKQVLYMLFGGRKSKLVGEAVRAVQALGLRSYLVP